MSETSREIVIASAARTPIGAFSGGLSERARRLFGASCDRGSP